MRHESQWERLTEPLLHRGILSRHTSGPFLWYPDGGAAAHRGQLWFMFGRDPGTRHLQCWVTDQDDDLPTAKRCTLDNLLVTIGRGLLLGTLDDACRQGDAVLMATYSEIIVECFGRSDDEVRSWRETVDFETGIAPCVERMFETK